MGVLLAQDTKTLGQQTAPLESRATRLLDTAPLPSVVSENEASRLKALQSELKELPQKIIAYYTDKLLKLEASSETQQSPEYRNERKAIIRGLKGLLQILPTFIPWQEQYTDFKMQMMRAQLDGSYAQAILDDRWDAYTLAIMNVIEKHKELLNSLILYFYPGVKAGARDRIALIIIRAWLARAISEMIDNIVVVSAKEIEG
jgi:hypothetical protein